MKEAAITVLACLAVGLSACAGPRALSVSAGVPGREMGSREGEISRENGALAGQDGMAISGEAPDSESGEADPEMMTIEELINEDIDQSAVRVSDPFQPVNRAIYSFNDGFYIYLLKPVSRGCQVVMPDIAERGISNVFTNLRFPKRFAGNLLQGKVEGAAKETGKFLVNSTMGVLGLAKASDRFEALSTPPEDIGQVLGKWRLGPGPYLVLPILGPNTLRDTVGMVGDGFLDPVLYIDSVAYRLGARAFERVNDSPDLLADYEALTTGAIDPYLALRDAYVQSREEMIKR